MNSVVYLEGGGSGADSKEIHVRCREGFRKLLENCSFKGRMPRLVACGGRSATYDDFKIAHTVKGKGPNFYVAMLIDSENPLDDLEKTWQHLLKHDQWERPEGAEDDQVLFMTTCMETWVIADHAVLTQHYGHGLQNSGLPPLENLESRARHDVQSKLEHATRNCPNPYAKGRRSFEILGMLTPPTLEIRLPSFARVRRILNQKLKTPL